VNYKNNEKQEVKAAWKNIYIYIHKKVQQKKGALASLKNNL
jgi:hypothetical protein